MSDKGICGFVNVKGRVCVRPLGHESMHGDDVAPFHQAAYVATHWDRIDEEDTKPDDGDDEPSSVPCSFPGCDKLTTRDATYGDLCFRHIRADNE